jgi:hypothetical protein
MHSSLWQWDKNARSEQQLITVAAKSHVNQVGWKKEAPRYVPIRKAICALLALELEMSYQCKLRSAHLCCSCFCEQLRLLDMNHVNFSDFAILAPEILKKVSCACTTFG